MISEHMRLTYCTPYPLGCAIMNKKLVFIFGGAYLVVVLRVDCKHAFAKEENANLFMSKNYFQVNTKNATALRLTVCCSGNLPQSFPRQH